MEEVKACLRGMARSEVERDVSRAFEGLRSDRLLVAAAYDDVVECALAESAEVREGVVECLRHIRP